MTVTLYEGDLPDGMTWGSAVAVDTETMGLNPQRDGLCMAQLSAGDGDGHLVRFDRSRYHAPNLTALMADPSVVKIFHYARFDIAMLRKYLKVRVAPIYCTKVASRLVRTYSDRHGLKDLCREFLEVDLSKQKQSSDWGAAKLSKAQMDYAASDVIHLHALRERLDAMLAREGRTDLAAACMKFLPVRAELDLGGFRDEDIFSHGAVGNYGR